MTIDAYAAKLDQLESPTKQNLTDLGAWTSQTALPWLWSEMGGTILEPKQKHPLASKPPTPAVLRPMVEKDAVRHGVMVSVTDRITKAKVPSFYQAQMTMLDAEARRYCNVIDSFATHASPFAEEAVIHTLHRALHETMRYARILLEDAGREITEVPGYFGAWRRKRDLPFEVFKSAEQIVYGTYSGMTHVDRAPYTPVAVLRTAIELRLRDAFCVYSLADPEKPDDFVPVDMSTLFTAVQKHQSKIEFEVDVHDVWKIYRWSNFYLHGGARDYPWVAGFLLQYLRPLFVGVDRSINGKFSLDSGIRMNREAWHAVRAEIGAPKAKVGFWKRLANAWSALFPADKANLLQLPAFDEGAAQCAFLN